jgi:hypothetical protein
MTAFFLTFELRQFTHATFRLVFSSWLGESADGGVGAIESVLFFPVHLLSKSLGDIPLEVRFYRPKSEATKSLCSTKFWSGTSL